VYPKSYLGLRRNQLNLDAFKTIALATFAVVTLTAAGRAQAQPAKTPYPNMAPLDQYLVERDAEITLARSAAPQSISADAQVMVLGAHGYEIAAKGKNGFVCIVMRSWTAGIDHPEFWNPKLRAPICFNPPAVRSYLPQVIEKTEWILAGQSKAQMFEHLKAALDRKELPAQEPGAMCYMMSKQQYLNDEAGHWHPHVMLLAPPTDAAMWGANLAGSPVLETDEPEGRVAVFMIPVRRWSDGTEDSEHAH
jgi:hypothetical protein